MEGRVTCVVQTVGKVVIIVVIIMIIIVIIIMTGLNRYECCMFSP